jgi:hypothetical protein
MAAKRKGSEPSAPYLGLVTEIAHQLESLALHPVLVGGMALLLAKTPAGKLRIASEADLLQLKTISRASRSLSTDEQDIAFLEARRQSARGEG